MKRMMMLLCGISLLSVSPACAGQDRVVTVAQMPQSAQQFIAQHFPASKTAYAKMERDFLEVTYEAVFTDGSKVEFGKDGQWKEVNCRYSKLPEGIVPGQILAKVRELYPDTYITGIDRDKRDIEVRLSNRLELTFDLKYNLTDIDD